MLVDVTQVSRPFMTCSSTCSSAMSSHLQYNSSAMACGVASSASPSPARAGPLELSSPSAPPGLAPPGMASTGPFTSLCITRRCKHSSAASTMGGLRVSTPDCSTHRIPRATMVLGSAYMVGSSPLLRASSLDGTRSRATRGGASRSWPLPSAVWRRDELLSLAGGSAGWISGSRGSAAAAAGAASPFSAASPSASPSASGGEAPGAGTGAGTASDGAASAASAASAAARHAGSAASSRSKCSWCPAPSPRRLCAHHSTEPSATLPPALALRLSLLGPAHLLRPAKGPGAGSGGGASRRSIARGSSASAAAAMSSPPGGCCAPPLRGPAAAPARGALYEKKAGVG
mmetsp:Transcript_24636/g.61935  ORF Transcript_24636/g.61935 Transcript_24636/m.61935 type:complete len:345 (+) Transcript_24636:428-1462(+)